MAAGNDRLRRTAGDPVNLVLRCGRDPDVAGGMRSLEMRRARKQHQPQRGKS